MINEENEKHLKASLLNNLSNQLPLKSLPDYETVKNDLLYLLMKIFGLQRFPAPYRLCFGVCHRMPQATYQAIPAK